jgi:5-(carboxyamino)imidazole ribonucleotide synthase
MLGLFFMKMGILGAGQLGRMLALAGYPLGFGFKFFDTADAPAGQLAELMIGDYADQKALDDFAKGLDVITYEFENVPVQAVRFLEGMLPVYPSARVLEIAQDRLHEKNFFKSLGIATPDFVDVQSRDDLEKLSYPCILKTRRMGYDGKGQAVLRSSIDADAAWAAMGGQSLILEAFLPFECEVSVIAARGLSGDIKIYPLTENVHQEGILRKSVAPADVGSELQLQAESHITSILEKLNYVGVLAIEFFVLDDNLIANEMAPRVHNSGHWTIEGAEASQFENHIRAVVGLPLGEVKLRGYSAMLNLIGFKPEFKKVFDLPHTHLHWYGKSLKPKRKVGHITIRTDSREELLRVTALVSKCLG